MKRPRTIILNAHELAQGTSFSYGRRIAWEAFPSLIFHIVRKAVIELVL